jgi:hypothetical protein
MRSDRARRSSSDRLVKSKGRSGHTFIRLNHNMLRSPQFRALSGTAVKVLLFLMDQYNGSNNGDLSATETMVERAGLCSGGASAKALKELREAGFILLTRTGHRRRCALYAATWHEIHECPGKCLEVGPTLVPSHLWMAKSVPQKLGLCTSEKGVNDQ